MSFKKPFRAVPLKVVRPLQCPPSPRRHAGFVGLVLALSILMFGSVWFMPVEPARALSQAAAAPNVYYPGCREARAAGVTPIYRGQSGYRPGMDGDNDGIACERYPGF